MRCGYKAEPLRIMISGAPASGKGTQCELITKKVSSGILVQFMIVALEFGCRYIQCLELL